MSCFLRDQLQGSLLPQGINPAGLGRWRVNQLTSLPSDGSANRSDDLSHLKLWSTNQTVHMPHIEQKSWLTICIYKTKIGNIVHNGTVKTFGQGSELDQVLTYPVTYTTLEIGSVLSVMYSLLPIEKTTWESYLKSHPWQTVLAAALKSLTLSAEQPPDHLQPGPLRPGSLDRP